MNSAGGRMKKTDILGVQVDIVDRPQLLAEIDRLADARKPALVHNVNVHACNLACRDPAFRDVLNASDLVFCDGFGVKLGARLLGKPLGERMTPPDWIDDLFKLCVQRRYSLYFLGDVDEVVHRFARTVQTRYPGLRITGWYNGFFDLAGDENQRILRELVRLRPDVILTGMGMPRQEKWARQASRCLGRGVFIATGALFRWYTGVERRAPRWMTATGFEWMARLVASPRRHFKRYVLGLPLFYVRILKQRFGGRSE
jgi:N-acetylglucosaminyldiphosphoundecaprenol N-acetyl-beta-D-mannosaminyltransferase